MYILGIDPGAHTGCAIFEAGKLLYLTTIKPYEVEHLIGEKMFSRVIFEDSRLQSHVWTSSLNRAVAVKMARNLGEVDAWCSLITWVCEQKNVPCLGVSPKAKGAKLDAGKFATLTGWSERSNQHERDSAMIAWPYRDTK